MPGEQPRDEDEGNQNSYSCDVYAMRTVEVEAGSPKEAARKATSEVDNGEMEAWVEGTPERIEESNHGE